MEKLKNLFILPENLSMWFIGTSVILLWFLLLFSGKKLLLKKLKKLPGKNLFHTILKTLNLPLNLLIFAGAISIATQAFPIPEKSLHLFSIANSILIVFAGVSVLNSILIALFNRSLSKYPELIDYSGMARAGIRIMLVALGIMFILDSMGISITPLIASLGVGSIAIALALQDTLANFFSGIYVLIDKPIKVGDFIELDENLCGYVERITARSTHIRMLSHNIIVVPNTRIASSVLTNYERPFGDQAIYVYVGVHYDSDLEHVENISKEIAESTMQDVKKGVKNQTAAIHFREFADSAINMRVTLHGVDYESRYPLTHEFIKRLHKRFNEEGIVIPFPMRTIVFEQKGEASLKLSQKSESL